MARGKIPSFKTNKETTTITIMINVMIKIKKKL